MTAVSSWLKQETEKNFDTMKAIDVIRKEFDNTMAYCGCNRVDEITPDILFGYYGRNTAAQFAR